MMSVWKSCISKWSWPKKEAIVSVSELLGGQMVPHESQMLDMEL